jgi:uncharacterized membrane protein YphA (DoxX/SURF4 family)
MSTTPAPSLDATAVPRWKLATRVAFRFCFVYFGLYCLTTQIILGFAPLPSLQDLPDPSTLPPMRQLVYWTAAHVFHVKTQLVNSGSGSGDKTWDWTLMFCLLVISLLATLIWSALDHRRPNYVTLHKWFRLALRFALASSMLSYGMAKVVPLQMSFPYLYRLLEPYGNRSPMGVLWDSIGASPGYEIFAGCAELFGGLLLLFPRTTLLGAVVCLADMIQVFMLNMTYDVPVKLLSFHFIIMSLVLLAPHARRLVNFFFANHEVQPSTEPAIGRTRKTPRLALALQAALGLWLLGANVYNSWKSWYLFGGGRPKSVLYGIWDIEEFSQDGKLRAPLLTDNDRFRRAVFDFTDSVTFEKMDNTFISYGTAIDDARKTMNLDKGSDKNFKATLAYQRDGDQLTLDGDFDKHKLHLKLHRIDHTKFSLINRGFHWIQEYPFNR